MYTFSPGVSHGCKLVLLISSSGMLGGIGSGLVTPTSLSLKIPFTGGNLKLGFLGDLFIGAIAAMASAAIFPAFDIKLEGDATPRLWLGLVAFGIVAGFAGERLLRRLSSQLLERLQSKVVSIERQTQASEHRIRGNELLTQNRLHEAEVEFLEALKIDPESAPSRIGLAKVQYRQSDPNAAILTLNGLLRQEPANARALYNRACYLCSLGSSHKTDALRDLEAAIRLQPDYAQNAQKDTDFRPLWDDPDFHSVLTVK